MEFLLLMWAIVAAVWMMVAARMWRHRGFPVSFCLGGLAVLLSGSVLGYEFFRIDSGPIPITIDRAVWGLLIVAYVLSILSGRQAVQQWDRMDLIVLTLLAVLTISTGLNDWSYKNNLPLSRLLFYNAMPIGLYFVVKSSEIRNRDLQIVAICMAGFGMYLGVTAFAETRGWGWMVFPKYILDESFFEFLGRGRGPFLNPVSNGIFLVTSAALALIYWRHANHRIKLLIAVSLAAIGVGILCTLTRSVWLGGVVAIGLLVWIPSRFRQRGLLIAVGGLAAILVLASLGQSLVSFKRDKHVSETEMAESAKLRPIFAKVAWEMFQENPFWGCGFGQYTKRKLPHLANPHSTMELSKAKSYMQHNIFLSYLTETGLLGMLWLILFLGYLLNISMKVWSNAHMTLLARQFGLVMIAFIANHLINGMFHDISIIPMTNMLLFFMAGITSNLYRQGEIEKVRALLPFHQPQNQEPQYRSPQGATAA